MVKLDQQNIDEFTKKQKGALVLFYADWCPYCQAFLKTVEKNRGSLKHELHLADISNEDNPLWEKYGIDVVPTLIHFSYGVPLEKREAPYHVGLKDKDLLEMDRAMGRA